MTELHIEYLPEDGRFSVPDGKLVERARYIIERGREGVYSTHLHAAGISNIAVYNQIRALCANGEFDPTQIFLHMPNGQTTTLNRYCAIEHYADIPSPDTDAAEVVLAFAFKLMREEGR